jgi:hypothetical protein
MSLNPISKRKAEALKKAAEEKARAEAREKINTGPRRPWPRPQPVKPEPSRDNAVAEGEST